MNAGAERQFRRRARARAGRRRVLVGGALLAGLVALASFACTPDAAPVGAGGECFVASDCEPGLVCVPQRGGARQCSSDLSQVAGRPPPEGGAVDTGREGAAEGAAGDGPDPDASMPDTSMPDTSVKDAAEAG